MPEDKSLYYYGRLYNRLLDPLIAPSRKAIVDLVPADASVLDVGCGTGLLCFELRRRKNCRVVGTDLSSRMLDFARSTNPFDDVEFLHQDATHMRDLRADSFDYVVILNVIHELEPQDQLDMLREAFRVGANIILLDASAPLPWNPAGIVKRLIEVSFGFDHITQFWSYISNGGIPRILEAAGYSSRIVDQFKFTLGCNHLILLSK